MCAQTQEDTWLQEAQAGSSEAFGRLVEHYERTVFAFILLRTKDRELTQELAQETFVRAFEGLSRFETGQDFVSWLLGIAQHVSSEWQRRAKMQRRVLEVAAETRERSQVAYGAEDAAAERGAVYEKILETIAECPEQYRLPLTMRYLDEMTYEEIAQVLQLSAGQVKGLLYRGKQMLREKLADLEGFSSR